ncbi:MAG: asparagine synthase (glutamine-hydrolyzing), partial [Gemmatimonadaceae bacterium]|nr:asparagine synthase (glutamine-hydrolyzing) [Gemmatimonadaceae bacterium]
DDAGLWSDDRACLGSCRLAILDLSPAGHMPMESGDGRYSLVFNGAIYNFVELRTELAKDVEFRSTGDTEVILNGFRVWGWPRLLDRLDGMFAFALWDSQERQLYAARDRFGEKPFFHTRLGDGFAFASTLTALVHLRGGSPRVDPRALDAYLVYQAVPSPLAMFDGISQLPPAHAIRFDAVRQSLELSRYWDITFSPKANTTEREALDTIDTLARRSVRQRLRSDVPTGTLLSGGVDSSLVTALASEEQGTPVDAVTMGYEDPAFDERRYARMVAERYGVRLHEEILAPAIGRDLPAIIWQYGQPIADVSIVPNYYMARAARRYMKVALVGDGADETFGGYARPMLERVAPAYRSLLPHAMRRALDDRLGERAGHRSGGALRRRLGLIAHAGAGSARDAFVYERAFRSMRERAYAPALLTAEGDWHPDALYHAAWDRAVGKDDVDRALYGDLTTYLPDQLLAKADVSAMAHGLEARSPFLGREIVEYTATLPTSLRLKRFTTKYLLKRVAERYVPREVLYRRKRGFVMPISSWLRGELAPYSIALLDTPQFFDRGWIRPDAARQLLREHADGSADWGEQIWTLMVLEVWARLSLDGTLKPDSGLDEVLAR